MRKGRHAKPHASPPDHSNRAPPQAPPRRDSAGHAPERDLREEGVLTYHQDLWLEGPEVHENASLAATLPLLPAGFWVLAPLRDCRAFSSLLIEAALTRLGGVNRFFSHLCLFSPVFSSSGRLHGRPRSQLWRPLRHHRECRPPSAQSTPSRVGEVSAYVILCRLGVGEECLHLRTPPLGRANPEGSEKRVRIWVCILSLKGKWRLQPGPKAFVP